MLGVAFVSATCGSMLSTSVYAEVNPVEIQQVFQQLSAHSVVRAQFEQSKQLGSVNKTFKSTGKVLFAKNNGVLWQMQTPVQADMVMTPKKLVQKTARTQSEIKLDKSPYGAVANVFLQLMTGDVKTLQQNFNIQSAEINRNQQPATWQIRLTPKAPILQKLFNVVEASGAEYVQRMVIYDKSQNSTIINFKQQTNQPSTLSTSEHALFQLAK